VNRLKDLTYADALREALREEMIRDPKVILLGEEIGVFGGVYKVTRGLLDEFGPERVRDTPISEAAIAGAAVGLALAGLKPVAEIMYMDFLPITMDQLATQAAKMHFMSGGQIKVPMVLRTQYSLGRQHGAQHSQFTPAWFLQVPGLKVVLPSNPYDAKGLLKSAIREPNPVLFVESGVLYRTKGPVPEEEYTVPLGKADVKRKGEDVTIVGVSRMVGEALTAAKKLDEKGTSAEVIDVRTLQPLDLDTIVESVKRTSRLIVASDDVRSGGVGSEISATVSEAAFDYLDAPILRVACPETPIPFSPPLEQMYMPSANKIIEAVDRIMA
jgi:pyruvate/2-oxoglutarate/acetoin dehydrogenase E1 component